MPFCLIRRRIQLSGVSNKVQNLFRENWQTLKHDNTELLTAQDVDETASIMKFQRNVMSRTRLLRAKVRNTRR